MEIKLKKKWRAFGEIFEAGKILKITDEKLLDFLKENGYVGSNEKKMKKKDDVKVIKENK